MRANISATRRFESEDAWKAGVRLFCKEDDKWKVVHSFGEEAQKAVGRLQPPRNAIQQLYVNPADGKVYLGEADSGATWKAYKQLLQIDPETGRIRPVDLPFNALDVAFDAQGLIYLRTTDVVVRYDPKTWREVPWDYGEELNKVGSGMYGTYANVVSGLVMPARSRVCFHQGGMSVSPTGRLVVACHNRTSREYHVEGARWFYGGVGYAGFNASRAGGGCACWFSRFTLDYFGRSFAPEIDQFGIAVLDSSGNLIVHIGRYGNVDDGKALILDGGPKNSRVLGGDEVGLFHACYVGTHTDHRLFISDVGNARLLSVKLDYHRTETVPLGARGPKLPAP